MRPYIIKYKDLREGDCWRFTSGNEKPAVMIPDDEDRPSDLPGHWDWDNPAPNYADWRYREVELLAHYSTHPIPTPLRDAEKTTNKPMFKVVSTGVVAPGQWYLGIWSLESAQEACAEVNADRTQISYYRNGVGPIEDDGYVVVHIIDHEERHHPSKARVNGLTGEECLRRYEMAMRTESLCRVAGGFVSTNAECALDPEQVRHAQAAWAEAMAARRAVTVEKDRLQVLCDPVDEMPNMGDA